MTRFDPAESFMMQLMADDLDAWWARIEALDLKNEFGVPEPRLPAMQPPHGHELVIEVTPTFPVVVDRDPHRLARVFSNLLSNSAKYTMKSY